MTQGWQGEQPARLWRQNAQPPASKGLVPAPRNGKVSEETTRRQDKVKRPSREPSFISMLPCI